MQKDVFYILNRIAQSVFDKKGCNILALDIKPCGCLADYVLIAEGSVDKHVVAIAHEIMKTMEEEGWNTSFAQGMNTGDWVVLDYGQIVVHLFLPEIRDRYQLETLWQKSEIVDVVIDLPEKRCLNI